MKIRPIHANEITMTRQLIYETFKTVDNHEVIEHLLVDNLRLLPEYDPAFDVVAIVNNKVVGHAFLSIVTISHHQLLCLAPLTVQTEMQRQGIGTNLIKHLETTAIDKGYPAIFILGDPNYYTRFNYTPAANYYIHAPFAIESKYFMVKELYPNSLQNITGVVQYPPPFGIGERKN